MKRMKLIFALLLFPFVVHAQPAEFVQTNDSPTILRSGPGEDFDRIAELPKGLKFQLETQTKPWTKVRLSNLVSGWIDSKSLKPASSASHSILKYIKITKEKDCVRMEILESEPGAVLTEEWLHPQVLWL